MLVTLTVDHLVPRQLRMELIPERARLPGPGPFGGRRPRPWRVRPQLPKSRRLLALHPLWRVLALTNDGRRFALGQATDNDKQGLPQVSCPQPDQRAALGAPTATVLNHQALVYGSAVPVNSSITTGR
jgi:hypothetical protein